MAELTHAECAQKENWEAAVNKLCDKRGLPNPSVTFEEDSYKTGMIKARRGSARCFPVHSAQVSTGGFTATRKGKTKREARRNAYRLLYYQLCSHIPKEETT